MRKQGFTLVELLAVIVILAVILAVAVPSISSLIENARKSTFENNAKMILKSMKNDYDFKSTSGTYSDTFILYENGVKTTYPSGNNMDFTFSAKDGGIVVHNDGTVTMAVYDGTYCITKLRTSSDFTISATTKATCIANIYYKQASAPFISSISNGDFSSGTTGWTGSFSTISASNNTLSMVATGGTSYGQIVQTSSISTATNPKVYVSGKMKVGGITQSIYIQVAGNVNVSTSNISSPIVNKWYTTSGVISFSGQTGNMQFKPTATYIDALSATGKLTSMAEYFAINLTGTYGAGNEPTAGQMDNNINKVWIDSATNTPKRFTAGGWVNF